MYGVTAFAAAQRRREIGVRMALGATRRQIVVLFLCSLRRPLLMGGVLGFVAAVIAAQLLRRANLLGNMPTLDPWAYGGAALLLVCVAGIATLISALRATRTEPWRALRHD